MLQYKRHSFFITVQHIILSQNYQQYCLNFNWEVEFQNGTQSFDIAFIYVRFKMKPSYSEKNEIAREFFRNIVSLLTA